VVGSCEEIERMHCIQSTVIAETEERRYEVEKLEIQHKSREVYADAHELAKFACYSLIKKGRYIWLLNPSCFIDN
jgi:hypothetical protein